MPLAVAAADHLPRHNRDLTLQRYLLLQEEHESIHRHLDELSSETCSALTSTSTTRTAPSPILSPTRASAFGLKRTADVGELGRIHSTEGRQPPPRCHARSGRRVFSDPDVAVDPTRLAEMLSEEARLCSINEGIKRSLTELLNCESGRCDQTFRQWIMGRLLEVEKELRSGRRRRSCPSD